jgi:hypothetical protein
MSLIKHHSQPNYHRLWGASKSRKHTTTGMEKVHKFLNILNLLKGFTFIQVMSTQFFND